MTGKLKVLDLFSGIGGFSLGLERTGGFETVAFCEIDPFCQRVLAKHWPGVPCYNDVTELNFNEPIDVITGGFPCQDISPAGKKAGIEGPQSSLWKEYARLVREIRPRYVIVENSASLLNRGMGDVLASLAEGRFDAEWQCIPLAALGAPHGRDRVIIVAYPNDESKPVSAINDEAQGVPCVAQNDAAHTERGVQSWGRVMARIGGVWQSLARDRVWSLEDSPIGMGVDDGVPRRMDRLRALGNAISPVILEMIGHAILDAERTAA